MSTKIPNVGIIILAAGDGKRMKSTIPKVLSPLHGKPLVAHVVDHVEESGCSGKPVVVVCANHTQVQDHLGNRATYVIQEKQLGTGHATSMAESVLKEHVAHVVVLYGDMPFLSAESINRLIERHVERNNTVTLMTVTVPNFEGKFVPFYSFGRIVRRSADGHIARIVEAKDASEEEKAITELNPSYFCFKAEWLWKNLRNLKNDNVQREYYLVDLVKVAIEDDERVSSISIDPKEALGVNTQEDLRLAHEVL